MGRVGLDAVHLINGLVVVLAQRGKERGPHPRSGAELEHNTADAAVAALVPVDFREDFAGLYAAFQQRDHARFAGFADAGAGGGPEGAEPGVAEGGGAADEEEWVGEEGAGEVG